MTEPPRFPTSLGTSDADSITLHGHDLATDLMGKVGFGELALWLVTQQRPASSVTPRNRDPPPSRPAARAPWSESGALR